MKNLLTTLLAFTITLGAIAEVPSLINYQGKLKSKFGSDIEGPQNFDIKVFDKETGGNLLYEENIGKIVLKNGVYSFSFGANGVSKIPVREVMAVADGEKQVFNYTTKLKPIVGDVKVSAAGYSWTEKGSSDISKFTATLDRASGSVSAIFITGAPAAGTEISVEYNKRGITDALMSGGQTWLELTVEGVTLSPRERLVAIPYALKAKYAEELQDQPLIPIYIFKRVRVSSESWSTNENNFSIERRLYFLNGINTNYIGDIYPGFSDRGPHIYIPENTKYLEINLLNKKKQNINLNPGAIFRDLTFSIECKDLETGKEFIPEKISYNKYAVKNPPSGMFETFFKSKGHTEAAHTINFGTDIIISIK